MNLRVLLALFLARPTVVYAAPPSGAVLDAAELRARAAFRTHQAGQPFLDSAVALPQSVPAEQKGRLEALRRALQDGREVQEGCLAPCADPAQIALYIEKIRLAAVALGEQAAGALVAHYAPQGKPRLRAAAGGQAGGQPAQPGPTPLEKRAMDELLAKRGLPESQRAALTGLAGRWASVLDQRKSAQDLPGGGAAGVTGGANMTESQRQALLARYRSSASGDSRYLRTLSTREVPALNQAKPKPKPEPDYGLTRMERLALWVDDKVGSDNIKKAADFSAGFGDSISFGLTKWARKKACGYECADTNSTTYMTGEFTGVVVGTVALPAGAVFKPLTGGTQMVARWAPTIAADGTAVLREGQFVMAGASKGVGGVMNWLKAGGPELAAKHGSQYLKAKAATVPGSALRYPIAEEGRILGTIKGWMGQRVYKGPPSLVELAL